MNLKRTKLMLLGIILLTIVCAIIVWPKGPNLNLKPVGIDYHEQLKIHEGLDLEGGSHLVYEADVSKVPSKERTNALDSAKEVIDRRVNGLGVSEPLVQSNQTGGTYRIIVELPGITDVSQANDVIGQTAKLEFWEPNPTPTPPAEGATPNPLSEFKPTNLSGADLKTAAVGFNQQTGEPEVNLTFNAEGTKKFGEITTRSVGKQVPIVLDGVPVSSPTIQEAITGGNAQITGGFSADEAKQLVVQLKAGALPVPLKLAEQRTIGPTLGKDSVQKSLAAGLIGLILVAGFMIFYYRLPGVLAVGALLVYTLIMVALFKLIPVTLTLAGIAGFILSIGIAVDANILIFERMKEELRSGRPINSAVEVGFSRAFTSIRDSNVASLLMSLVLYTFGSGTIRGFAVVLALGVAVSFFSAITVTRTFVRLTARTRLGKHLTWWGLRKDEVSDAA
ncbi:protein translocase subunit SecD [Patescibacteria group bacterium]|nr:protein translocase subunit SecD [Patescibacteria group bacterium]